VGSLRRSTSERPMRRPFRGACSNHQKAGRQFQYSWCLDLVWRGDRPYSFYGGISAFATFRYPARMPNEQRRRTLPCTKSGSALAKMSDWHDRCAFGEIVHPPWLAHAVERSGFSAHRRPQQAPALGTLRRAQQFKNRPRRQRQGTMWKICRTIAQRSTATGGREFVRTGLTGIRLATSRD
jgi:hypothetical protein